MDKKGTFKIKNQSSGVGIFRALYKRGISFFESFSKHSNSIESTRRIYLLIFISFIGILNLIPLGILAKLQNNEALFIADFIVAFILILNLFHVRGKTNLTFNLHLGITVTAMLFVFLYLTGGVSGSGFVWYFTFPLIASYLIGSRNGAKAGVIILLPVLLPIIFQLPKPMFIKYSDNFQIRFVFAYVVVLLFSYLFENSREKTRDELLKIQDNLEDRIKLRTTELSTINLKLKKEVKERRRIEDALRESVKNYRLITESTSDLIAITSFGLKPVYTYISPSHKQLGYEPEDLLGRSGFDIMYPADKKKLFPLLKKYAGFKLSKLVTGAGKDLSLTIEYRVYDKSGNIRNIESTVNIIEKKLLFVSRDITERKNSEEEKIKLQEKLSHSEKMESLGKLAGRVAHDLNNVLGGIVSYPDLILMSLPDDSEHRSKIIAIKKSGEKAAAMIDDLLGLARRGVISKHKINLNDIVSDYIKSPEFEKLASYHPKSELRTDLEPNLFEVNGSAVHLNKMIMNLVSNAAEAMINGGNIQIITYNKILDDGINGHLGSIKKGKYSVIKIIDEGIGIDSKSLRKIFEPFYTKKVMGRSGTGLGMSVVLGTVIDHNGDLIVRSKKNKGTEFEIYFPRCRTTHLAKMEKEKSEDYFGKGELILIVDDDEDQRNLMETLLVSIGYRVETVPGGEEAIKYIKKKTPDLMVLDMVMDPGIDGLETYLKIKDIKPDIKAILCSGYSETNRIKKALVSGVGQYIKKPFTLEELGRAVSSELNKD